MDVKVAANLLPRVKTSTTGGGRRPRLHPTTTTAERADTVQHSVVCRSTSPARRSPHRSGGATVVRLPSVTPSLSKPGESPPKSRPRGDAFVCGLPSSLPVKKFRRPNRVVFQERLATLDAAEEAERRQFASEYGATHIKGSVTRPFRQRHLTNPYYVYFTSVEGDQATTEQLIAQSPTPTTATTRLPSQQSPRQCNTTTAFEEPDDDDALTYTAPRTANTSPVVVAPLDKSPSSLPMDVHRSQPLSTGAQLLTMKPQSAMLYVKYEKLYQMMVAEDTQFLAFRRRFLKKKTK